MPKPRTCGFCGSAHPDDLIELVKLGWEVDPSTKPYKSYWHPPGFKASMRAWLGWDDPGKPAPTAIVASVVPPVKLYHNHLSSAQASTLNALLALER
jgi:hypothetical protein